MPKLRTWKQMECALDLMVANCVHFNGDDSHLSKTARGIRAEFTKQREKEAVAEALAVAAPAEQATDFMPRLRSAKTETLPPRRCVACATRTFPVCIAAHIYRVKTGLDDVG